MTSVLIIMPCGLPVPAIKGGAIATLIESIIKVNEEKQEVRLTIFTSGDQEAREGAKKYPNTEFIWYRPHSLITAVDKKVSQVLKKEMMRGEMLKKLSIISQAKKILDTDNFDKVIIENSGFLLKIFSQKKLKSKYKGKIYYHLHNDIPDNIDRKVLNDIKLILVSEYLKKKVYRIAGPNIEKRCYVVKNGIDVHRFQQQLTYEEKDFLKKQLGIPENKKILIFVGRINSSKGIEKLLDAMQLLDDPNIILLIVGSTNFGSKEVSEFERNIQKRCIEMKDRVYFTGFIHNNELWKYYKLAHIAVLPSMWEEPAGLTMIEAAAAGLPVITTDSGGIPEYMEGLIATLLKRDAQIVNNMVCAIRNRLDNEVECCEKHRYINEYIWRSFREEIFYREFIKVIVVDGNKII